MSNPLSSYSIVSTTVHVVPFIGKEFIHGGYSEDQEKMPIRIWSYESDSALGNIPTSLSHLNFSLVNEDIKVAVITRIAVDHLLIDTKRKAFRVRFENPKELSQNEVVLRVSPGISQVFFSWKENIIAEKLSK
jgi:hypothetical protein